MGLTRKSFRTIIRPTSNLCYECATELCDIESITIDTVHDKCDSCSQRTDVQQAKLWGKLK